MQKKKSLFYVFLFLSIFVIIGVIIIKAGRRTPPPLENPEVTKTPEISKPPVEKEKSLAKAPTPTPARPEKKEAILTEKAPDKDSGLTISGRVMLYDGSPASEAKINLTKIETGEPPFDQEPVSSTTADKNGNYTITVHNFPVVFIKASYPGYAKLTSAAGSAVRRPGSPPSGGKHEVTINFTLPPASYLKGRVVDEKNNPLQGVSVTSALMDFEKQKNFSLEKTATDKLGRFDIQNIPPGKITIGAASLNYTPESREVTAPSDDLLLKLLPANASLSGRVFLKRTGEPITSATVRLITRNRQSMIMHLPHNKTLTDSTGFFSFEYIASGQYVINAYKKGLFMLPVDDLQHNRLELLKNEKKQGLKLFLYEGHTVKGQVTDKQTGAPIEGARVSTAWGASKTFEDITDANGFYMLKGLSGTRAGLVAEKENYILAREQDYNPHIMVTLHLEELELTKNLQMIPGLFISGRVETDQGVPVTDARVYLYQMHDWQGKNKAHPVDQRGAFKLMVKPFTGCFVKAEAQGFPASFSDLIKVQDKSVENIVVVMKPGASISGSVNDEDDNSVEGARVRLQIALDYGNMSSIENLGELEVSSDPNGRFKAENLPSGKIILSAEKENYANSKQETITLNSGEEKTDVILKLTTPAILAGNITDPDGNPLENVRIHAYASMGGVNSHGNVTTGADGYYSIEGLHNTPHTVNLSHSDYGSESHQNVEVGREDADFVMGEKNKTTLIGNVKDWKTGNPIENFEVSAGGMKPEKDPDIPGRFVIKNLNPENSYKLKIESEGYQPLDTGHFRLPKNQDTVERTYELGPGGGVKGRVVSKATQNPLQGVGVYLYTTSNEWEMSQTSPAKTMTTLEDGLFSFEAIPAGKCLIHFVPAQPLTPKLENTTIRHGDITDMGDVDMTGGGVIRGKLVQMPDEIPLPAKNIALQKFGESDEQARKVITDEQGSFEFTGVPNGRYSIRALDYNISEFAEVMEDEENEYILRIGTGGLKGLVLKNGKPQVMYVNIRQTHIGTGKHSQTDSNGAFEITDLVPGTWKISFYGGGYSLSMQELVEISADKITEKTFELPSGRIVGKVVNAEDEPVEGARVSARLMHVADAEDAYDPKTWSAVSDKNGEFAIADLLSTSYAVSATKKDLGLVLVENIVVPDDGDSAPVLLRLEKGKGGTLVSVALNLTDANPVPEAWCYLTTAEGVRFDHGKERGKDGVITIPNIPAGTYRVQVSSHGFSVHEHIVEIKDGETVELEDVMYEAGALRWTVLDEEGHPVANAPCRIEPMEENSIENPRKGFTDAQGLWIQRGLYPGAYRLKADLEDGRRATDTIEIQAHQLIQKNIVVK